MPNLHFAKPVALHLFTVNVVVSVALKMCFVYGSSPTAHMWPPWQADASDCAGLPLFVPASLRLLSVLHA